MICFNVLADINFGSFFKNCEGGGWKIWVWQRADVLCSIGFSLAMAFDNLWIEIKWKYLLFGFQMWKVLYRLLNPQIY